jgi:hypothetical protein
MVIGYSLEKNMIRGILFMMVGILIGDAANKIILH